MVALEVFEDKSETMEERRLFVGNLPNDTSERDLQKLFKKYNVSNIEIKRKNVLDQESVFAFVNVASKRLDSCLKEIGDREWNHRKLKIEVAKESFLERLKKERNKQTNCETVESVKPSYVLNNHKRQNEKIVFDSDDSVSDPEIATNDSSRIPFKRNLPMFRGTSAVKDGDEHQSKGSSIQGFSSTSVEKLNLEKSAVDASMKKFEAFSDVWKDDDPSDSFHYTNETASRGKTAVDAFGVGWKRNVGTHDRKLVNNSKYVAEMKRKTALEEKWNSIREQKSTIRNALKNMTTVKKSASRFEESDPKLESTTTERSARKVVLFDDSENDEFEPNFEVKPHLEGERGVKLLKFKSKFAHDDRFKLDERFLETDVTKGKANNVSNVHENRPMIRYDPTKPDHQILEKKGQSYSSASEMKKKKKLKKPKTEGEKPILESVKPEVSKEKYYSVADTLKDAFKKTNEKPTFSLSAIFDEQLKHHAKLTEKKETSDAVPAKKMKFLEAPFRTASGSDDEEDSDDEIPLEVLPLPVSEEKALGKCGVWGETFFFKPNDTRLKEAVDFYRPTDESKVTRSTDFNKQRSKLKQIVRKKIQNSRRDNKLFKQKLGGKLNKAKFKMRLKKASS